MSYILDALKKLEQEKATKSRSAGKINIIGELFGGERSRPVESRRLRTVLLVFAAVLLTFAATWFLLTGPDDRSRTTSPASSAKLPVASSVPSPVPVAPVTPPPVPDATPHTPAIPTYKPEAVKPPEAVSVAKPVAPVADEEAEGERRRNRRPGSKKTGPSQIIESPALKSGPAPANIMVSGIAWQDDRNARRAVVNGFLLREGAVVSGAKITEILQDRVRFSLSGTTFEVTFISAGPPGTGK